MTGQSQVEGETKAMEISDLALKVVLALVPGLMGALLIERLTIHKSWSSFRFTLYAFLVGIFVYSIMQGALELLQLVVAHEKTLTFWSVVRNDAAVQLDPVEVVIASAIAIVIGSIVSLVTTRKVLHRLARRIGLTDKFGDESLFYFYLNSPAVSWVRISVASEGKTYEGLTSSFSEDQGRREVALTCVKVYRSEDSAELYSLESVYLSMDSSNLVIEAPPAGGGEK